MLFTVTRLALFSLLLCLLVGQTQGQLNLLVVSADVTIPSTDPLALFIDETNRILYVAESFYNRVLRFDNIDSLTDSSLPSAIFGQPSNSSFSPNQGLTTPNQFTLSAPNGVAVDSQGTLWVADRDNHRVVWYKNASTLFTGAPANGVIGQPNFFTATSGCTATTFHAPLYVSVFGTTLWVADGGNSRILRFDNANKLLNGSTAIGVIGAPNFTINNAGLSASQFLLAYAAVQTTDGLYVTDYNGKRMLFFPTSEAQKTTGAQAAFIYGQPVFNNDSVTGGDRGLSSPAGMDFSPDGNLFLADQIDERILIYFPTPPTANFEAPTSFVGVFDPYISGGYGTALNELHNPSDVKYDYVSNKLWVADTSNARVSRYSHILPVVNNSIGVDVDLQFQARAPNVWVYPKGANGTSFPGQYELFILPTIIEELDTTGKVVNSLDFPLNYVITSTLDANNNQVFDYVVDTVFSLRYTLFAVNTTTTSAGVTFSTAPSSLKFEVQMNYWNFSNPANTLRLHLALHITPNVTSVTQPTSTVGPTTTYILHSANLMTTTLNLISYGVLDGTSNAPVSFYLNVTQGSSVQDLQLHIPHFTSSFQYDPDFAVTLGGDGSSSGGTQSGDGGSGGSLLPLLSLIALVIPLVAILIAVVILIVWYVKKYQWRKHMTGEHSVSI